MSKDKPENDIGRTVTRELNVDGKSLVIRRINGEIFIYRQSLKRILKVSADKKEKNTKTIDICD